ncbi:MAG TPA: hypothetical protein ENN09_06425 [Planctomycetes bacterium]|nr:hypothetical protein [Planctomycetota bacterium]
MFRKVAVAATLVLAAGAVLAAQEEGRRGERPGRGAGVRDARGGGPESNDGAKYTPSALDRLTAGGGANWVYMGRTPDRLKLLNLTTEQAAAIEQLCKEARDKVMEFNRESQQLFRQRDRDPNVFQERREKLNEITSNYETKINDLLTDEQKEMLVKIDELIKAQQDEIRKMYEEMNKKVAEVKSQYDKKLVEMLTPEQKALLEQLMTPAVPAPVARPAGTQGAPADEVLAF